MEAGKKGLYVVQSLLVSYVITGIILCLLAFFMYQTEAGIKIANIGVTMTYVISSVLAGIIIGKKMGKRKFLWGMLAGFLYFLILMGISMLIHENAVIISGEKITALLLCTAGGTLGGMLG